MKKFSLIILCIIIFGACTQNNLVDPTVLPAITNTGADNFGCLIDDWVYIGGRYYDSGSPYIYDNNHSIIFQYFTASNYIDVSVKVAEEPNNYLKFRINDVSKTAVLPQECTFSNARFAAMKTDARGDIAIDNTGTVIITELNDSAKFISGIFYGNRITEGRFDMHYLTK
jgi:hypothetical protein